MLPSDIEDFFAVALQPPLAEAQAIVPATVPCGFPPLDVSALCLGSLAYGAHFVVACLTLYAIYRHKKQAHFVKHASFIMSLLMIGTVNWLFCVQYAKTLSYECRIISEYVIVSNSTAFWITVSSETFLMWRCYIIWKRNGLVLILPSILYILVFITGIYNITHHHRYHNQFSPGIPVTFDSPFSSTTKTAYWGLSMCLNLMLTSLIVYRILRMRRAITAIGGAEYGGAYASVAMLVVESSMLYSVVAGLGYAFQSPSLLNLNSMFSPLLAQVECIASELIILRIALGHAWLEETSASPAKLESTVQFEESESSRRSMTSSTWSRTTTASDCTNSSA